MLKPPAHVVSLERGVPLSLREDFSSLNLEKPFQEVLKSFRFNTKHLPWNELVQRGAELLCIKA